MSWLSDPTVRHLREVTEWPDLGARYEIVEALGEGGMGKVYRAHDRELDRDVALKVLAVARLGRDAARRMMREARILAGLEHPGIVPIHDVGSLADGRVYYTMKLVKGSRLDAYTRAHPELNERLRVFERMCEAVAFAHAHGVVHRDLKPENVMVGAFGEVLVMDWGVAKILGELEAEVAASGDACERPEAGVESGARSVDLAAQTVAPKPPHHGDDSITRSAPGGEDAADTGAARAAVSTSATTVAAARGSGAKTHPGTILGTPGYMAPEQAAGQTEAVDQRADVYALGRILGDLIGVAGRRAPRSLAAVIAKATAERREERYQGVGLLAVDIANFLSGNRVTAHRETAWERAGRIVHRFRTPILLILAYAVIRVLIFIFAGT